MYISTHTCRECLRQDPVKSFNSSRPGAHMCVRGPGHFCNGLLHIQHQAIILINAGWIKIQQFLYNKSNVEKWSSKRWPFCLELSDTMRETLLMTSSPSSVTQINAHLGSIRCLSLSKDFYSARSFEVNRVQREWPMHKVQLI